jgi:hypothetical protein
MDIVHWVKWMVIIKAFIIWMAMLKWNIAQVVVVSLSQLNSLYLVKILFPTIIFTFYLTLSPTGKIIERFFLHALDRYWHNSCLKCSCCGTMLADIGTSCFTKNGMILCKADYSRWVRRNFKVYFKIRNSLENFKVNHV